MIISSKHCFVIIKIKINQTLVSQLPYGFLNEIMDHPCSDGVPGSDMIVCIKFNEGCTKFCEGCTKGFKMRSEVGIGQQSLSYGFLT